MVTQDIGTEPWRARLSLPVYTVGAAARYAETNTQRVSYWQRGGGDGQAATLSRSANTRLLSYLELIEVAVVATMRSLGVPLVRIRRAREYAVKELKTQHPFADYNWKSKGLHLLLQLRELEPDAQVDNAIIGDTHGQMAWHGMVTERFGEFDYEGGLVLTWHPRGRDNGVTIDPRIVFGTPAVRGVPTWAIRQRYEAGQTQEDIVDDFRLDVKDVMDALTFEGLRPSR